VNDDNPSDVDTLDLFEKTGGRDPFGAGFPLQAPRIREFYQANTADFTMERDEEASLVEDYEIDEDVLAAYFMANFTFDQFEIIAGARVEHTEMDSSGVTYGIEEINDDDVITITRNDFSKDYTNWMPGVHFKYTVSENLITRASWTNTIARPTFGQNFPGLLNDNGEVEAGNPDLDPYEASNFDLSVEYYAESLGLFSAAVFYKDVENFIYEQTSEPNTGGIDELTTFRNGPSGEIYGLELAFQRQIDFIPGLGVYAAATFTDGEADVLAEDEGDPTRALPFVKQSDFIGQLALTYERGGYFVRLAATQRSEYLDEVGGEEIEDRYVDSHFQLDLSTAYYVNDRLTLNATLNNLTNEPFRASWGGGSGRLSQFEEYGWWATLGLEWKL
jgi:TonB-dependent receptor